MVILSEIEACDILPDDGMTKTRDMVSSYKRAFRRGMLAGPLKRVGEGAGLLAVAAEGEAALLALEVVQQVGVDDMANAAAGEVAAHGADECTDGSADQGSDSAADGAGDDADRSAEFGSGHGSGRSACSPADGTDHGEGLFGNVLGDDAGGVADRTGDGHGNLLQE